MRTAAHLNSPSLRILIITAIALVNVLEITDPSLAATLDSRYLLPVQPNGAALWWALSTTRKIQPDQPPPAVQSEAIRLSAARNERDAAQVVLRPTRQLTDFTLQLDPLHGPNGAVLSATNIEILQVQYLEIRQPSDRSTTNGLFPDPLLPIDSKLKLEPGINHAFWLRVFVPSNARAGVYRTTLHFVAKDFEASAPLQLTVFDFTLPERMTCTTAFGFSPGNVFRYHRLKTDADKRLVLDKYWADLAAHHISPYDPAPLDGIRVQWPDIHPPKSPWADWTGLRLVTNEVHSGRGALLLYDDKPAENVTATFQPLLPIPSKGLRLQFWYRTAVPDHRFIVTFTHFDAQQQWFSGRNRDITLRGNGTWQHYDHVFTNFPAATRFCRFQARATMWTDHGENLGLVWLDDLSLVNLDNGQELLHGGDFEPQIRTNTVVPPAELAVRLDFEAWDRAMTKAIDRNHFNSFRLDIPGIGGGTFHEIVPPSLLGFNEDTPEYPILFDSYCRQLQDHLKPKGWLDEAFVYWFDEPDEDQYPFVMNGFAKLKRSCPGIARMLTEQVEPALLGGPNIWCSIIQSVISNCASSGIVFQCGYEAAQG